MATNRYLNIQSFVFTPVNSPATQNAPITLLGVQSLTINDGASVIRGAGDGDLGPTSMDVDHLEPMFGVKFEDIEPALLLPLTGLRGSAVAVIGKSGGVGTVGALVATLSSSLALTKSTSAAYRKYADSDVEFHGIFVGGVNPLSVVRSIT